MYVQYIYLCMYVLVWFKYIRSTTKVPGLLYLYYIPKSSNLSFYFAVEFSIPTLPLYIYMYVILVWFFNILTSQQKCQGRFYIIIFPKVVISLFIFADFRSCDSASRIDPLVTMLFYILYILYILYKLYKLYKLYNTLHTLQYIHAYVTRHTHACIYV